MKRVLLLTVSLFACWVISQHSAQAQPEPAPDRISLDGTWSFKTDLYQIGEVEGWFLESHSVAGWDSMQVPGNWDLRNEYAYYVGPAWYRTSFKLPASWENRAIRLTFDAVYNDAEVWLNGEKLGDHHVGFLRFDFDIGRKVRFGQPNTLVVRVDNSFKRGAIWNWGGIRRPVWLEATDWVRPEVFHITSIPDLDAGTASVEADIELQNLGTETRTIGYAVRLFFDGEQIIEKGGSETLRLAPGEKKPASVNLPLRPADVHLWHVDHPHLYEAELVLYDGDQTIHQARTRFGIRKIEIDGYELKLNGEAIRPVGFNIVAEDRTTGNTLPLWRIKKDVDMMKALGANMARVSHLPLPQEFLDYLDEKGFLTIEEVSLWGKDEMVDPDHPLPRYWLETMIRQSYNHPSIIGWSVGNEIGYVYANPKVMAYVESATRRARELDPNRLVVYVSHSAHSQETDPVEFSDLILMNRYGGWGTGADRAHELHPGKPIFFTEYGLHLNHEDPNEGEIDAKTMLDAIRNRPYVIGASLWTFNDYRSTWTGTPTWTTPPSENRTWGIVNTFRQKKRAYDTFRKQYAPVGNLDVAHDRAPGKGERITTTVTWHLRPILDIPANPLRGYRMVWYVLRDDGTIAEGGFEELPDMLPGGKPISRNFSWEVPSARARVRIDLVDPQLYSVYDSTLYLQEPSTPRITHIHTGNNAARIMFEPGTFATAHKVRYGTGSLDQETELTINPFVDVPDLDLNATYRFQVVAVNASGESKPSEVASARIDEDELPPVIWHTEPSDRSFFVGYSVAPDDFMFEVEYGTAPGRYDHRIGLRNAGVLQVPQLENGQTYYYRLRRRRQWGFASEWTQEHAVTPDGGLKPSQPRVLGVLRRESQALLVFEPVHKATGYVLTVKDRGRSEVSRVSINAGHIQYAWVDGLKAGQVYSFELQAVGQYGTSTPSSVSTAEAVGTN